MVELYVVFLIDYILSGGTIICVMSVRFQEE